MSARGFSGHYFLSTLQPYPVTLPNTTVKKNQSKTPVSATTVNMAKDMLTSNPYSSILLGCRADKSPRVAVFTRDPQLKGSFHLSATLIH